MGDQIQQRTIHLRNQKELAEVRHKEPGIIFLPHIRCYTCGKPIGRESIHTRYIEGLEKGEEPRNIFEKLNIKRECCRLRIANPIVVSTGRQFYDVSAIEDTRRLSRRSPHDTSAKAENKMKIHTNRPSGDLIRGIRGRATRPRPNTIEEERKSKAKEPEQTGPEGVPISFTGQAKRVRRRTRRPTLKQKQGILRVPKQPRGSLQVPRAPRLRTKRPSLSMNKPEKPTSPIESISGRRVERASTSTKPVEKPKQIGGGLTADIERPSPMEDDIIPTIVGERFYREEKDVGEGYKTSVISGYRRTDPNLQHGMF